MNLQNAAGWRGLFKTPTNATPYKVRARAVAFCTESNASLYGLYFYDGTKLMGMEFLNGSVGQYPRVEKITNVTTDSGTANSLQGTGSQVLQQPTFQIRNDGSKLWFDFSLDGINFFNVFSENVGTFITPTKIGFGGLCNGGGNDRSIVWWTNWTEYNDANLN